MAAYTIYADEMASLMHGHPLWEPECHPEVSIADVGYIRQGRFCRLFNASLPLGHPQNEFGVPDGYEQLILNERAMVERRLPPGPMVSRTITKRGADIEFTGSILEAGAGFEFSCAKDRGAVLIINSEARRKDSEQRGAFKKYMLNHYRSWLSFANNEPHFRDISLSDLVFVTGRDVTADWAMAAFSERAASGGIYFEAGYPSIAGAKFSVWGSWKGFRSPHAHCGPEIPHRPIEQGTSSDAVHDVCAADLQAYDQCVFVRGFRMMDRTSQILRSIRVKVPDDSGGLESLPQPLVKRSSTGGSSLTTKNRSSSGSSLGKQSSLRSEWSMTTDFTDFEAIPEDGAAAPMEMLLAYILEYEPKADVAIVHDDDLALILKNAGDRDDSSVLDLVSEAAPHIGVDDDAVGTFSQQEVLPAKGSTSLPKNVNGSLIEQPAQGSTSLRKNVDGPLIEQPAQGSTSLRKNVNGPLIEQPAQGSTSLPKNVDGPLIEQPAQGSTSSPKNVNGPLIEQPAQGSTSSPKNVNGPLIEQPAQGSTSLPKNVDGPLIEQPAQGSTSLPKNVDGPLIEPHPPEKPLPGAWPPTTLGRRGAALGKRRGPDSTAYNQEQERVKGQIGALQARLSDVKGKISLMSKSGPGADRQAALRAELDSLRDQQLAAKASRDGISLQLKRVQDENRASIKEIQNLGKKLPVRTMDELESCIGTLERRLEAGSMSASEEKKVYGQIGSLRRTQGTIERCQALQAAVDAGRARADELRTQLDTGPKALSERYNAVRAQLDTLQRQRDDAVAHRSELFRAREELQKGLAGLREERRVSVERFQKVRDEFWRAVHEQQAEEAERARAEKSAQEERRRGEARERLLQRARAPAFVGEIQDCRSLLEYFAGKGEPGAQGLSASPQPSRQGSWGEESAHSNFPGEGWVPLKKKKGEDDAFFVGGKTKAKKGQRRGAGAGPAKVSIPLGIMSTLLSLAIAPPQTTADVPRTIEDLRDKIAWFEVNQRRVTDENVARTEAALQRIGHVSIST